MSPKAIIEAFYAALAQGDIENAYNYLDNNFTLIQAKSLPYGGEFKGRDSLTNFFTKFNQYWKVFRTVSTEFYEVGNTVFAVSKILGENYLKKKIDTEMIQMYKIKANKIMSAQPFYFDTALIIQP